MSASGRRQSLPLWPTCGAKRSCRSKRDPLFDLSDWSARALDCVATLLVVMLVAVFALTLFLLVLFGVSWPGALALGVLVSVTVTLALLLSRRDDRLTTEERQQFKYRWARTGDEAPDDYQAFDGAIRIGGVHRLISVSGGG